MEVQKSETKVRKGKTSRAQGNAFEVRVREDLEEKGWIVAKWTNNVEFDYDADKFYKVPKGSTASLIKAKAKWAGPTRPMMMGAGFPDFIAFKRINGSSLQHPFKIYDVIGVESKLTGELDKAEKEKCKWLLDNKIFSKILIAEKTKVKNRVVIVYHDFKEKYKRFYK